MNPEEIVLSLEGTKPDESDAEFNRQLNIVNHEECYTDILKSYSKTLQTTLEKKLCYKKLIFWLSFMLLCIFPIIIVVIICLYLWDGYYDNIAGWCSVIIPALISFLIVFIVIPQVITQYLFNADEEKYMSDIIKHIQDYDKRS